MWLGWGRAGCYVTFNAGGKSERENQNKIKVVGGGGGGEEAGEDGRGEGW